MLPIRIYFEFQRDLPTTDWNMITAILAVVISIIALVITIYNNFLARKHDRLSVRPWLDIQYNVSEYKESGLSLVNEGIGPAIITEMKIYYNNELIKVNPHKSPWNYIIKKFNFPEGRYRDSRLCTQTWLPAKETVDLFVFVCLKKNENETDIERKDRVNKINSFIDKMNNIRVELKYQSCYAEKGKPDEYFQVEYNGAGKESLDIED